MQIKLHLDLEKQSEQNCDLDPGDLEIIETPGTVEKNNTDALEEKLSEQKCD